MMILGRMLSNVFLCYWCFLLFFDYFKDSKIDPGKDV